MLSKLPIDIEGVNISNVDKEILRAGVIAELDACSLYEQLVASTEDEGIKAVFTDVIKEEKTHVGEFLALLKSVDKEQTKELLHGKIEVAELIKERLQDGKAL